MSEVLASRDSGSEVRSTCGALLARLIDGQLEFKCRRSRSLVRISLEQLIELSKQEQGRVIWVGPGTEQSMNGSKE